MSICDPRVAARAALADYLAGQLGAAYPKLTVSQNWPTPQQQFPDEALTVIVPPSPPRVAYHRPVVWQATPNASPAVDGDVRYSYGTVELDLQIDAWAPFEAVRDALSASLEAALNRSAVNTVGQGGALDAAPGLVLTLPLFYDSPVEYRFQAMGALNERSDTAMVADWRATFSGTASLYLMNEEQVAFMKTISLSASTNGDTAETFQLYP